MSNMNTVAGVYNVANTIGVSTANRALLVPAAGVYAGFPSPVYPASSAITVSAPPDIAAGEFDGHSFRVAITGAVTLAATSTFGVGLWQVPAVAAGGIGVGTSTTNPVTTAGIITAGGNPCTVLQAATVSGSITGPITFNFGLELALLWDSVSKQLGGWLSYDLINGVAIGTWGTAIASPVASVGVSDLNFVAAFTFGTANAANVVTVREFVINRA